MWRPGEEAVTEERKLAQAKQGSDRGGTGEGQGSDRGGTGVGQGRDRGVSGGGGGGGSDREATGLLVKC